jgi:hypothetical protein
MDSTDATGRWSCSALGFDSCHVFVSGAALLIDSADTKGRWSCSAPGFDRFHVFVSGAALLMELTDTGSATLIKLSPIRCLIKESSVLRQYR